MQWYRSPYSTANCDWEFILRTEQSFIHTFSTLFQKRLTKLYIKTYSFQRISNQFIFLFCEISRDSTVSQKSESSLCPRTRNFSAKLVSTNRSKERPKLSVKHRVIHGIEPMLQSRMNSRSATPLHASCPKHSSHCLVEIKRTLYQKKLRSWAFIWYIIHGSCCCKNQKVTVEDWRKLSCSRKL